MPKKMSQPRPELRGIWRLKDLGDSPPTERVSLNVGDDEFAFLCEYAEASGTSVAGAVRKAITALAWIARAQERLPIDGYEFIKALNGMHRHVDTVQALRAFKEEMDSSRKSAIQKLSDIPTQVVQPKSRPMTDEDRVALGISTVASFPALTIKEILHGISSSIDPSELANEQGGKRQRKE